jgi:hypothetical protein
MIIEIGLTVGLFCLLIGAIRKILDTYNGFGWLFVGSLIVGLVLLICFCFWGSYWQAGICLEQYQGELNKGFDAEVLRTKIAEAKAERELARRIMPWLRKGAKRAEKERSEPCQRTKPIIKNR